MTAKPINFINLTELLKACATPQEIKRSRLKDFEKFELVIEQALLDDKIERNQKQNTDLKHLLWLQTLTPVMLCLMRYKPINVNF
jgi:hypothetical protein